MLKADIFGFWGSLSGKILCNSGWLEDNVISSAVFTRKSRGENFGKAAEIQLSDITDCKCKLTFSFNFNEININCLYHEIFHFTIRIVPLKISNILKNNILPSWQIYIVKTETIISSQHIYKIRLWESIFLSLFNQKGIRFRILYILELLRIM